MKQKIIFIGNGHATGKTLEYLFEDNTEKPFEIKVFGEENYGFYNRILLSSVLAQEKNPEDITIFDPSWYQNHGIKLFKGQKITQIDSLNKNVYDQKGNKHSYDKCIIATGSLPFMLPLEGAKLPGVIGFRDLNDVQTMADSAEQFKNAVVIGGGLLGLEAAYGLLKRGMNVTVIQLMENLMERQLDFSSAKMLEKELSSKGMRIICEAKTQKITGKNRVEKVILENGEEIPADLVVMAVGIIPNKKLAEEAQIECQRGILISDNLQSSADDIYAIGECVQQQGQCYGLVAPIYQMAKVLSQELLGNSEASFQGSAVSSKLKVSGVDLFSAGNFQGGPESEGFEEIVLKDASQNLYKKLVIKEDRLVGAILYGDSSQSPYYWDLIQKKKSIKEIRSELVFGPGFSKQTENSQDIALSFDDDQEICGCNGVSKGQITSCIKERNLKNLAEVRAHTKASASCGSCTNLVCSLLKHSLGDNFEESPQKAPGICACTDLSHDEIRLFILENKIKHLDLLMEKAGWKSPDGCHKCRPTLNYYLLCAWPQSYVDDGRSRFINERVHANIQKDGSYSVIPRIFGGVTSVKELRAITDAAEKYEVKTVKITGGQRIDLLGIQKQDLPKIWKDLGKAGLVSGHAYGKSVRTVKTCVGQEWCRFGVQDSTKMGIELEKLMWGAWTPHKVKLAVSGCPRNCAEATIKDIGVVAVESGWEIHIGGNGGTKVRVTDFFCKVKTEKEVLKVCGAILQLYREKGRYLERTSHWVERVGLESIKEDLFKEKATIDIYFNKFLRSQIKAQVDPWKERAEKGVESFEFKPLKTIKGI